MSRTFLPQTSSSTSQSYKTSLERQDTIEHGPEGDHVPLRALSPRSSHSYAHSSRNASLSPPPSFYRDHASPKNQTTSRGGSSQRYRDRANDGLSEGAAFRDDYSPSPSRSKTKDASPQRRHIMFAAPPPPIATSMFLQPQGDTRASSRESTQGTRRVGARGVDPLMVLERREKAIQGELQVLLDAQSEGLLQGFGGGLEESRSSTPTARSVNGTRRGSGSQGRSGIVPVRQPKIKPLGLRAARRGLLQEMSHLAEIKSEESLLLEHEIERRSHILRKIDTWERRISTAKKQLSASSTDSPDVEITTLESEQATLDKEILDLEDRLAVLKARRSQLTRRLTENINKREARLSSYRGALREAELEVKSFLQHPPIAPSSILPSTEETFINLPSSRRTLSLAREWWTLEHSALTSKKVASEREQAALDSGSQLWGECIATILTFEDDLRTQMKSGKVVEEKDLRNQVEKMGDVIDRLKRVKDRAVKEGWNLLIFAVAAEEEAFRLGRGILREALGEKDDDDNDIVEGEQNDGKDKSPEMKENDGEDNDDEKVLRELENGFERDDSHVPLSRLESAGRESTGSEDDGPNLEELLIDNRVD